MKYTLYITGFLLWILATASDAEVLMTIGWTMFVGGMIVERIDKLERKLTKQIKDGI